VFNQITEKVDQEDWYSVLELDHQAYQILEPMYEQIDEISDQGVMELNAVRDAVQRFDTLTYFSTLLAVPIFLILASIAALVIYQQINQPIELLTNAANSVMNGSLNLPRWKS
jgi:nitrogen fixation/metabolism regulation signal transduction histidine kinase